MRFVDLVGQRVGRWTVLSRAPSARGMTKYRCRCSCGKEQEVFSKHLLSGSSKGCHPCSVKRGALHRQWNGIGEISGAWWADHVGRSVTLHARRPLELTIDPAFAWRLFLLQDRRCALSGLELVIANNTHGTASIDRIDSNLGTFPGTYSGSTRTSTK